MNNVIVIPQNKNSIIASIENETITEIGKIAIPFNSKSIITKNSLIVSLNFDSNSLNIYNLDGDLLFRQENAYYKAINFKNNIVYLGGENKIPLGRDSRKGEMFSVINLENINFELKTIDLPINAIEGKSIDDILINKNELILVDNLIFPKYLIKYDISLPNTPVHISKEKLPNNGTYEHIIKGDINNDWFVIFSSTTGRGGSYKHITISGKTKGHLLVQSSLYPFFYDDEESKKELKSYSFRDIALVENYLFILRTDGLGYIDLNKKIANENFKFINTNISNISKIIKSNSGKLIAVNEDRYVLIRHELLR